MERMGAKRSFTRKETREEEKDGGERKTIAQRVVVVGE